MRVIVFMSVFLTLLPFIANATVTCSGKDVDRVGANSTARVWICFSDGQCHGPADNASDAVKGRWLSVGLSAKMSDRTMTVIMPAMLMFMVILPVPV